MSEESVGAETSLQRQLYRGLFQHMQHEVHIWKLVRDERGEIVTWTLVDANPAALAVWKRDLADIVGKTTDEIFGDNVAEWFLPIVRQISESGVPYKWEQHFPPTDQFLHMVSIPLGEYFISTGLDITERRRRERKLEETMLQLRQAIRAGKVGLWDWDLRTDRVHYSEEWKRQLGHQPHEIGDRFQEWESRVHPDDLTATLAKLRASVELASELEVVFRLRHGDGSYRWILAQGSFITDGDGRPVRMLGSHIDITESKRIEHHLREAQKLESLGTLAGGIAHDFNNLLMAILANVSLARSELEPGTDAYEVLSEAEAASMRAGSLTQQLLTFAKGGVPCRKLCRPSELIEESVKFVVRGSKARCEFAIDDDLASVNVDVGQLNQVLNNVTINAIQAMPNGGTVRVAASNVELAASNPWSLTPGNYVRVTIADEGSGIAPEDVKRIFEPFFSTKSGGSGLGLATSYSIMRSHGGRIAVDSSSGGGGATFQLYLPAARGATPPEAELDVLHGQGRVLVMDDDAGIRRVMVRMLEKLGYRCDTACDGKEAVRHYAEARAIGDDYQVVILDLTVPGGAGGREALAELTQLDPSVTAIVSSGYSEDPVLGDYGSYGFKGMIHKPVSMAAVSQVVSQVLRQREPKPSET